MDEDDPPPCIRSPYRGWISKGAVEASEAVTPGATSSPDSSGAIRCWVSRLFVGVLLVSMLLVSACAGPDVIPAEMEERVDRKVTFARLKEDPTSFQGKLVVVGGVVLSGKLLKDRTRIEVLELPLDASYEPGMNPAASRGRFLAFQKGFLDPATLPTGTRVTILGEVTGAMTLPLDETEYTYPTLTIKKLTVWPRMMPGPWFGPSYPYFGVYWGSFWGPYVPPPPGFEEQGALMME